jgi:hypothetical protein
MRLWQVSGSGRDTDLAAGKAVVSVLIGSSPDRHLAGSRHDPGEATHGPALHTTPYGRPEPPIDTYDVAIDTGNTGFMIARVLQPSRSCSLLGERAWETDEATAWLNKGDLARTGAS